MPGAVDGLPGGVAAPGRPVTRSHGHTVTRDIQFGCFFRNRHHSQPTGNQTVSKQVIGENRLLFPMAKYIVTQIDVILNKSVNIALSKAITK